MTAALLREGFDPARRLPYRRRPRLTAEVLVAYLLTRRSLSRHGLRATLDAVRRANAGGEGRVDAANAYTAYRLGRIVERVLRFLPDARCLTRSLVLVEMLARRGIGSTLVIGVAPAPDFRAHAWVELDGIAVLPAHETEYSRLVEL